VREPDIKATVLTHLRKAGDISSKSVVANEYAVGRTSVRADLAILQDEFIGVEIKSQYDSLRRLPRQLSVYRQFFDRTILVVAERHLSAALQFELQGVELWVTQGAKIKPVWVDMSVFERRSLMELLTEAQRVRWSGRMEGKDRSAFVAEFNARFGPTSEAFWTALGRRRATADDLSLLSRFRDLRIGQQRLLVERAQNWSQWAVTESVAA